jgi:hypothetical protein
MIMFPEMGSYTAELILNPEEEAILNESALITETVNEAIRGKPIVESVMIMGKSAPKITVIRERPETLPIGERADLLWDINQKYDQ